MKEFETKSLRELESAIRESSMSKEMGDELIRMGQKRAQKVLTKNKAEIKRLEALGHKALFECNREAYIYAVGKIRKIIGKPTTDDVLEMLWRSSRDQVAEIIKAGIEAEKLKG